ncbi:glycerophosphodiester phosphodiesterase [Desulfopila sp. IMCC35006]|uniref:glycerophosphodiester phosphodiesterase n=1 Tax=Desulfopila sp. IMCC35006 TaxID=2569542 RepID=UPI0010ACFE3F|nr:glycerophosphodiester phosphodiesterase family protein [Desulfopila sp. IMCC35006]TKB25383.1 glycerophosphodiester phosphodiesterase [Desulfopila sp. IMCC35006]
MTFFDNFQTSSLIAAHRGFRAHHPENTLSAFKASVGRCHFIELDIQMSKDFVPVVFHDPTLDRTSNAKEQCRQLGLQSLNVCDWTLSQLKTLDIGSWFLTTDPFGTLQRAETSQVQLVKEMPQTVMTLEEVLRHPALRKIPINVEIKDHRGKKQNSQVTEYVLDVIGRTNSISRVLISSFNHDYLVIAKDCAPAISTAALQHRSHPRHLVEYLKSLGVAAYHPADDITDAPLIKKLRAAGFGVNVYTINSTKRQQELFSMGATAVFTDFPALP